ncbi:MAG: sulfate reduction electron transfer complex DsrMKJOP subunit DsrJ [Desulfobacterales bacterium]|nr:sulfate reduction electron transfer complex DsrMKJOP subunit DsrJ [Deltaproteobacteria bacterium]MBT8360540.1 sulfate reduction electron transfer complex DsrMKJOP subunit DsrJ [Deltaproteobacteria bacterium]NNK97223.1 sulfate reduction electron transfer complex DsrMKJOP subunit DsrJ [Desulfobacterales bacterium]
MYNKGMVIAGLIIFVLLVTFPIWFNRLDAGPMPKPELPPGGEKECVAPAAVMRDTHMQLLNEWRDDVTRNSNREVIVVAGKEYGKGLQLACMQCHSNKEKFCDSCHEYAAVQPTCWDCHISPTEAGLKKEAQ